MVLTRNESTLISPHQCNISRDLDRDHGSKRELHSSFSMRSDFYIILNNVQSVFSDQRLLALYVDLDAIRFDICRIAETWTRCDEKHFMTPGNKGVGIIIKSKIRSDITSVKFVTIHCRLYFLNLAYGNFRWRLICAYMPDSWSSLLDETQTLYDHAAFPLQQAKHD